MTTAAVVLTAIWFVTAFALRIAIQLRRTGDTGVRVATSPGSLAGLTKVLFLLSTVAVGVGPVLVATDVVTTVDGLDTPTGRWLGVALAGAGILATFVAQLAMGRSWRIGVDPEERTELVTGGVFALVRNPIFSTMALTAVGLTLLSPNVITLVATPLMVLSLELQVRVVEEPYLRRVHGPAFTAYTSRVGRFVPSVGRTAGTV